VEALEYHIHVNEKWLAEHSHEQYFLDKGFSSISLKIVNNWDPNWESDSITMTTPVPRLMKSEYYGNKISPALEGVIETYNYHMTQYVAVYLLWKKYGYPKANLDIHIRYHVDKIIKCHNKVLALVQQLSNTAPIITIINLFSF
jgi:hypothetical protein